MSTFSKMVWQIVVTAFAVAAVQANAQTSPATVPTASEGAAEPELILTLSVELSAEPGNKAAVVGRIQRNHWLTAGDNVDIVQRVSSLRKEMVAKYTAPFARAGFQVMSHELRLGDYRQFITADKKLATQQAAYRNLYGRQTSLGLVGVGWGVEALRIDSAAGLAPYLADYVNREGATTQSIPLLLYWAMDRRRGDGILPKGHFDQLSLEWGLPFADVPYTKVDVVHESYWQIASTVSTGFNVAWGRLDGRDGHLSPIGKRYYGGGTGSVRGYESGALGPLDVSGANMGAERKATGTAEVLWHAFDIGQTPIIISLFSDHGRFSRGNNSTVDNVSAGSQGLGISVPMPFGIARFYFADPNRENLRTQRFQFEARASWR